MASKPLAHPYPVKIVAIIVMKCNCPFHHLKQVKGIVAIALLTEICGGGQLDKLLQVIKHGKQIS